MPLPHRALHAGRVACLGQPALKIGQNRVLQIGVQSGERLIQQQHTRDAAPASAPRPRAAVRRRKDGMAGGTITAPAGRAQPSLARAARAPLVTTHAARTRYCLAPSSPGRAPDRCVTSPQPRSAGRSQICLPLSHTVVPRHGHVSTPRPHQSGDAAQQRGLARAGGPDQHRK